MNSLRELKRRVTGLRRTAQLTGAMKMVSAIKMRRQQAAWRERQPYLAKARDMLDDLVRSGGPTLAQAQWFTPAPAAAVLLVLITSDRGLCGNVNHSVIRRAQEMIAETLKNEKRRMELCLIGRKGADFFRQRAGSTARLRIMHATNTASADIPAIYRRILENYHARAYDRVVLVYTLHVSTLQHHVATEVLLPLQTRIIPTAAEAPQIFEPSAEIILQALAERLVSAQLQFAIQSSALAEHAARMTMMEQATKKAQDLINRLKLNLNKARQAQIDRELADIIAGVEASA